MKSLVVVMSFVFTLNLFAEEIRFKYSDDRLSDKKTVTKNKPIKMELDLGDTLKSIIIEGKGEYIVIQQTETSVTVMNEGPHYDLTDWKHGYSKKVELSKKGNEFLYIDHEDKIDFPKVDMTELASEAKKVGGKAYEELAKKCKSPKDYPCAVSASKHKFWIKKKDKAEYKEIGVIEITVPMGC